MPSVSGVIMMPIITITIIIAITITIIIAIIITITITPSPSPSPSPSPNQAGCRHLKVTEFDAIEEENIQIALNAYFHATNIHFAYRKNESVDQAIQRNNLVDFNGGH